MTGVASLGVRKSGQPAAHPNSRFTVSIKQMSNLFT